MVDTLNNPEICIYDLITSDGMHYVGKTTETFKVRTTRHFGDLRNNKHCNKHLSQYYKEHGKDSIKAIVLEVCTKKNLGDCERKWISLYKQQGKAFNILSGGSHKQEFEELHHFDRSKEWQILDKNNQVITFFNYIKWCSLNNLPTGAIWNAF